MVLVPVLSVSPVFTIPIEAFFAARGDVDQGLRREFHDPVDARHMVVLDVVDHHVLNSRGVNKTPDTVDRKFAEIMLHRIDKRHVFIEDEIVIVGCAVRRYVAVKIPHRPVYCPHPVDTGFYLYSAHENLLVSNIMLVGNCRPGRGSGISPLLCARETVTVKLYMVPKKSKIPRHRSRQIDGDPPGYVHDLATQDANKMMMATGIRVVALSYRINGKFAQDTRLRKSIQRIIDCRDRQRPILLRNCPVYVLCRGM
jgi:hypothetical protein